MTLSEELQWRGQIKDKTFEDVKWLDQPKTFYLGVDCSSDSMTIGNLAVFMTARRLLDAGWKTVLLVGGATSLIGDPGGKDSERDLKTREEIQANVAGIKAQVQRLFADKEFTLVDNYDWFKDVGYLEFLRDIGKHYSMTELLQRDFIATRIGESGSGISYAEFSYSLIQGYDYWHLNKKYGVELQLGGSDQWGNMLSGVPLIRKRENKIVHALSTPLVINKTTGVKFGKSEDGAVWLDEKRTSPYKLYQFWLNVDDEGVEEYLKIYTLLSKDEIEKIMVEFENDKAGRLAQKTLAYEVTKLVHGQAAADSIVRITKVLFGGGDLADISSEDVDQMKSELPTVASKDGDLLAGVVQQAGLASSLGEARRFMEQNGVALNGQKVGPDYVLTQDDRKVAGSALLRRGKNNYALIDIANN
jgi:tyrosyl-tRNA synthetase